MSSQTTRERQRHIAQLFCALAVLISLHVLAIVWFEDLAIDDALWLTLTTVTTVGYGDFAAQTAGGRLATVILLYIIGIFLLAQIAGEWIDYRFDRSARMHRGLWRWKMQEHILILNTPDNHGDHYLRLLVEQIRDTPLLGNIPIQIFSPQFSNGLPSDLEAAGVVLHSGRPEGRADLSEVNIESARFIVLMSVNTNDPSSDSINLDLLDQFSQYDIRGHVIVECVLESNRNRLKRLGANAVLRPIRAYPELLVRSMAAPGTEAILEDLFVYAGNHPRRYDVDFQNKPWGQLASLLLQSGLGTPLGYEDANTRMVTNPAPGELVSGGALFLMVSQDSSYEPNVVAECLAAIHS